MSEKLTLELNIEAYEQDGKWWAYVRLGDESIFHATHAYANEKRAIRHAKSDFQRSIRYCKHEWEQEEEYREDNAWGGIDYVIESHCKNCGLRDTNRADHSIYSEDDYGY